jgi:hypothetical protein
MKDNQTYCYLETGYVPIIPVLGSLKQEDCKFEVSLGYVVRPCLKQTKPKQKRKPKATTPPPKNNPKPTYK